MYKRKGQRNLIPFVTRIDNLIAIKGHVNFVLLAFSIFTRDEISYDADVAIEDIEFGIVDQMENFVVLTEENIIKGKLIGLFLRIKSVSYTHLWDEFGFKKGELAFVAQNYETNKLITILDNRQMCIRDMNSPFEKAQLLRLSFEYNEKKKDYYLSYNSVARRY